MPVIRTAPLLPGPSDHAGRLLARDRAQPAVHVRMNGCHVPLDIEQNGTFPLVMEQDLPRENSSILASLENMPSIGSLDAFRRVSILQPFRLPEAPVQSDAGQKNGAQDHEVAVRPFQFRHVFEVHAVDAGHRCRDR